ncbi:MAG: ATP-dependent Clp protease proteolytic subunit [Candidatus Lloydbacteria bacterium]|nr:ATP-dependent Clp protease proteolytic subunit [Candidatus Lloydbacteria bacterium]
MRKKHRAKHGGASHGGTWGSILSEKRRISLFGDVNKKCAYNIIKALRVFNEESESKKIYLFIDSLGGYSDSGHRIAEAIRASKAPVYGIVMWAACSVAFEILQVCKKRIASHKGAEVMCHGPDLADIQVDEADRDTKIKKREEEHTDFLRQIVARSKGKLSFEMMCGLSRKEEDILAPRALQLGLLDQVM